MDNEKNKVNMLQDIKDYFKGVKAEWFRITWPEKQQVFVETIWVIFICTAFTLFILVLDMIFKGIFSFLK